MPCSIYAYRKSRIDNNRQAPVVKLALYIWRSQRKQKQDTKSGDGDATVIPGEGYVVTDRNSLLEKLKKMDKYNDDK